MSDANVWNYVIGAYAVTWLGLIGYSARLMILSRRAKQAVEEIGGET